MKGDEDVVGVAENPYGLTTHALVLHCSAAMRALSPKLSDEWDQSVELLFADPTIAEKVADEPRLTILTYNTRDEPCLFELCMRHLGLRVEVLGKHLNDWSWADKITLVHERLTSHAAAEYVLCVDGFDTLLIGDPRLLLKRFQRSGADMLFASTATDWPPSQQHREFETAVAGNASPAHHHLNASYIGATSEVVPRLADIMTGIAARESWCHDEAVFDDQLAWREMHRRHYPRLKIDLDCEIFTRFDKYR